MNDNGSKFSVWLGDGWPGLYLVTVTMGDERKSKLTIAVEGATDPADAVKLAVDAVPWIEESVQLDIRPVYHLDRDGVVVPTPPKWKGDPNG